MATSLDRVIAQMMSLGMPEIAPHELRLDTARWQRYGPQKKAYYRILRKVARSGREYFTGAFGFKGNGPYTIEYEGPELSPAEVAELARKRAIAQQLEFLRREREIDLASRRAMATWRRASRDGSSAYLEHKKVRIPRGWIRYLDDVVVVPMVRYDLPAAARLKGIQLIHTSGDKRFTAGMAKVGCAAVLGCHRPGAPIVICEGLATAASVFMGFEHALRVVVAFDAGNLQPVAEIFRRLDAAAPIAICADDDSETGEVGYTKAMRAARTVGRAQAVRPRFREPRDPGLTDFNDLHVAHGFAELQRQVGLIRGELERM